MANSVIKPPPTGRLKRWLKILALSGTGLLFLLVITYFIVTSSGFFKGVILPKVGKAIGADVTVSSAEIHPFSRVILRDLKVAAKDEQPLFTAQEIRASYSLWSIIHGNIVVNDVAVNSPVIALVTKPDGTSNLDPLLKQFTEAKPAKESPPKTEKPSTASKPLQVDIKKIAITKATVRHIQQFKDGKSNLAEISGLNFSADNIKNGQTAKLALQLHATLANNPPDADQAGLLNANANGDFSLALTDDLMPASVTGGLQFKVSDATGALAELAALAANLQSDINPTEIKHFSLSFLRGDATLGEILISGPFDMAKNEGRVSIEIRSIDRQVLNLAGAATGIDFGTTTINSASQIEIGDAGKIITVGGRLDLGKLQIIRASQTTPTLDLNANYQATVDLNARTALLRTFVLDGQQNSMPFLHANLTSPMNFAWGEKTGGTGDSSLTVALNDFNLADWKALAGDLMTDGMVNANLKLLSQQGGQKLAIDLTAAIDNLAANIASNRFLQGRVSFSTHIDATNLKQFQIASYQLQVTQAQQPLVALSGNGSYDLNTADADLQMDAQANLANLFSAFPEPDVSVQSGRLNLKTHIAQKQSVQTVTGTMALENLTGSFAANEFSGLGSDVNLDVAVNHQVVQLHQIAGKLLQGANVGGSFNLSGQYNLGDQSGRLEIKLDDLNENVVRPFLQPMLADKKLVSVSISANAAAQYDPKGATSVKADVQVAKLLVTDSASPLPGNPLEAKLQVDASWQNQIADVRQFQIALTPTSLGKNEVNLQGRVDLSKTNDIQGGLKLSADSLDLTRYYDLFAGTATNASSAKPAAQTITPAPVAASPQPEGEPAPVIFPFQNFTMEASIGKIFLHEIEIADFQTRLKLDGGHIWLKPFQFSLNGKPVSANVDLNLGVPGYQYDVAFNADAIPLTPLVNTFQPDRKGQIGGTASADVQIKGAGVTGVGLQKNLAGQFSLGTTNMNLALINLRNRYLVTLINTITSIPELLHNPKAQLSELWTNFKTGVSDTGFAGEINHSPINVVALRGTAGNGKIEIQDSLVQSAAFESKATGTITLNSVLTNSTLNIPVGVSLERSVAQNIGLGGNTPTNAAYADLPQFVTMLGTIGNPKPKIEYAVVLKMAANMGSGIGKDVADIYKAVTRSTNSASTNGVINRGERLINNLIGSVNSTNITNSSSLKKGEELINDIGSLFNKPKKK